MARYFAEVEGNRQPTHRLGTASSGIRSDARGWSLGVSVYGRPDYDNPDQDEFVIRITGGSNQDFDPRVVGVVWRADDGTVLFAPSEGLQQELGTRRELARVFDPVDRLATDGIGAT
jgi:hypothetical protein